MVFDIAKFTGDPVTGRVIYDLPWADVVFDCWRSVSGEPVIVSGEHNSHLIDLTELGYLPTPVSDIPNWIDRSKIIVEDDTPGVSVTVTVHLLGPEICSQRLLVLFTYEDGFRVAVAYRTYGKPITRFDSFLFSESIKLLFHGMSRFPTDVNIVRCVCRAVREVALNPNTSVTQIESRGLTETVGIMFNGFSDVEKYYQFITPHTSLKRGLDDLIIVSSAGFMLTSDDAWFNRAFYLGTNSYAWSWLYNLKKQGVDIAWFMWFKNVLDQPKNVSLEKIEIQRQQWETAAIMGNKWFSLTKSLEKASIMVEAGLGLEEAERLYALGSVDWERLEVMADLRRSSSDSEYFARWSL